MKDAIKAISTGFSSVHANSQRLTKALFWPVLVYLVLTLPSFLLHENHPGALIASLMASLVMISIAVAVHRIILHGQGSTTDNEGWRFGSRELLFIVNQLLMIFVVLPLVPLALVPVIGELLFLAVAGYFLGRFALIFPGLAIDRPLGFRGSWNATKGHGLTMFLVVGALPFCIESISLGLGKIPGVTFAVAFSAPFLTVYVVAALSAAYQVVVGPASVRA